MSFDARVGRREHLDDRIRAVLEEENVGFGFGALAAGADILVAEALLERGAELHAVLPGGREAFASVSVDPFGKTWRRRFEAVLERAETVRMVRPVGAPPDLMTIGLGDEVAMGAAVINARRLESSALQLLVVPEDGHASGSNLVWAQHGWRQRIVAAPREALPVEKPPPLPVSRHQRLALLAIAPGARSEIEVELSALHERLRRAAAPGGAALFHRPPHRARLCRPGRSRARGSCARGRRRCRRRRPLRNRGSGRRPVQRRAASRRGGRGAGRRGGGFRRRRARSASPPTSPPRLPRPGEKDVRSELIGELEANDGGGPIELHALKPRPAEAGEANPRPEDPPAS